MKNVKTISENNDAVSPVIGVILMVAITVILAAVIAAYVFGVGGGVQKQYMVGAVISQVSPSQIDVTYLGGGDADSVDFITVRVTTADGVVVNSYFNDKNSSNGIADILPGTASIVSSNNFTYIDHVIVTATFLDGNQQVIMERYV